MIHKNFSTQKKFLNPQMLENFWGYLIRRVKYFKGYLIFPEFLTPTLLKTAKT